MEGLTEDEELMARLKDQGHSIGHAVMREDGMPLYQIDGVLIFRSDAVDLVNGSAALDVIIKRNKGRVFPNAPNP
jgi:hypothetical protein